MDQDRVSAHVDAVHARHGSQRRLIRAGQGHPETPAAGQALDLGGGPVRHDLALADQADPAGIGVRLLQVVRRKDDRPAQGRVIADGRPEAAPALHVHALGRLVQDEQPGIGNQRHGEPQPLLFSPRALPDPPARDRGDARPLQHLPDRTADGEKPGSVRSRLSHSEVLEQTPRLHDRGDQALTDRLPRRHAVNLDRAGIRAGQAQDHVDRRGLPGAVGTQESHHLPGADGQGDSPHGLHRTEMLVHAPQVAGHRPDRTVPEPRQHTGPRIVPGHPHFTARRPCHRHGTLAVPAALAAPPEQRAPAYLVPDREEHDHGPLRSYRMICAPSRPQPTLPSGAPSRRYARLVINR
jgi:hypothetical protein